MKLKIGKYKRGGSGAIRGRVYHFVDGFGFMCIDVDNMGTGDAIERNYLAYKTYGDEIFVRAVLNQWKYVSHNQMQGFRHPFNHHKMSRDHYMYTLALLKAHWDDEGSEAKSCLLKMMDIVKSSPDNIVGMMRFGKGLIYWANAILGDVEAEKKYLKDALRKARIYRPIWWLGNKLGGFGDEVDQMDWKKIIIQDQSWRKRVAHSIMYPAYALSLTGVKLDSLDDNFPELKAKVKKAYLPMVGKTNYAQQLLFDGEVDVDMIKAYRTMEGGRWSGYLNERNDRNMQRMCRGYDLNHLDVDYIRTLYNEKRGD